MHVVTCIDPSGITHSLFTNKSYLSVASSYGSSSAIEAL